MFERRTLGFLGFGEPSKDGARVSGVNGVQVLFIREPAVCGSPVKPLIH